MYPEIDVSRAVSIRAFLPEPMWHVNSVILSNPTIKPFFTIAYYPYIVCGDNLPLTLIGYFSFPIFYSPKNKQTDL